MLRRFAVRPHPNRRYISTSDAPTEPATDDPFTAAWRRIVPNLDPPKTPLAFRQPPQPSTASKLTVNLVSKYSSCFTNMQVDKAIVPAVTEEMSIIRPGHMSSMSELKPGLLSIHEGDEVTKYFISSGFAFVHSNSVADIIAVEAVPIEHVDPDYVKKGLAEFTQKMNISSTVMEKVEAQVAVDVLTALNSSLSGSSVDS